MGFIKNNLLNLTSIFLDRDGVINKDTGYVGYWKDFIFLDGVLETLKLLTKKNIKIIIITNQSGIARGLFSLKDYKKLTQSLKTCLLNNEINITDIYFCPHHPEGKIKKYTKICDCRKPGPGMFFKAINDHKIDVRTSAMVGDNISDIEAAFRAGIKKNYLINKNKFVDSHLKFVSMNTLKDILKFM